MPDSTPTYDPPSREGGVYQADPIPAQASSPHDAPDTVAETPAAGSVFQEGDRVVCADGVARTVQAMAPLIPGEPARVVVEDGTQWIAVNCRRANPADLACARQASHATAARVHQADPDDPQWRAALADLTAPQEFLKAAETNSAVLAGLAHGEAEAARELKELERLTAPAEDQQERALREEAAALFVVLSRDGRAHSFEHVQPHGATSPVAWTYRTGYGHDVRYGWVLAGGRLCTETATAETRWEAEQDAVNSIRVTATRDGGNSSIVDSLAHACLDELRAAVDGLRDKAARTRGTSPRHALDDDVRAALEVLAACHFAEVPRDFNPNARTGAEDHTPDVTGLVVEPAANGHVAAYWVEHGRYLTPDGSPFTAQLRDLRRRFQDAGWKTVPGTRPVVTACPVAGGAASAEAAPDPLAAIADLHGRFEAGYTADDILSVFRRIHNELGLYLVCVWEYADWNGFGGNSQFYAEDEDGRLYEVRPDIYRWLNGQQETPGRVATWVCVPAAVSADFPVSDDFHNYARADLAQG